METIATGQAPQAIGPYAQAIRVNGFVFTSGQIALEPVTGNLVDGGIAAQTRRVMENLKAVLSAAGTSFDRVVKSTVYLTNLGDFQEMNKVYAEYFGQARPARSTVGVAQLPRGALVEIDVVALAR